MSTGITCCGKTADALLIMTRRSRTYSASASSRAVKASWGKLQTYHDRVPTWLLPVAGDEYGNLFAISLRANDFGSVWFWDHEEEADEGESPAEGNIELKAPNWAAFLEGLQPIE
jgi:hypothetical protein